MLRRFTAFRWILCATATRIPHVHSDKMTEKSELVSDLHRLHELN